MKALRLVVWLAVVLYGLAFMALMFLVRAGVGAWRRRSGAGPVAS